MNPSDFAATEDKITPPSDDQIAKVIRTVAGNAHDASDLRLLLKMLGITGQATARRAAAADRTHCPQGHEYTEANTYRAPGAGHRHCRTCRRAQDQASKARKAESCHNAFKTHCDKGHEYTPENTYRTPNGWRRCRTCTTARHRAARAAAKAAA